MQTLTMHKRGDTWEYYAVITDGEGNPMPGIADKLKCQIRSSIDDLIADVDIEETDNLGEYKLSVDGTDDWAVANKYMDIQYTDDDGKIVSSETLEIPIEKDVTR